MHHKCLSERSRSDERSGAMSVAGDLAERGKRRQDNASERFIASEPGMGAMASSASEAGLRITLSLLVLAHPI
jgi:hypothetical protein